MIASLGMLKGFVIRGSDVAFRGYNYVAVAFDRDDPVLVTVLHAVSPADRNSRNARKVCGSGELYDFRAVKRSGCLEACFSVPEGVIRFHCEAVTCGTRYYTQEEIDAILDNVSGPPNADRSGYLAAIEKRRLLIAKDAYTAQVNIWTEMSQPSLKI